MHGTSRSLLGLLLLGMLSIPFARAQDNATINGTVTDPTGALVPNASVTLTNQATDQIRSGVSNDSGIYRFANVGVGNYMLTVSAPGFIRYTKAGIVVNVAQTLEENVALKIGSQSQTVTVQADALQVQTESNELSDLISGEQVTQIATNGRNVANLATLSPGVSSTVADFNTVNANTTSNSISFNGTRPSHNVYLLDGAETNDRGCGGCFDFLPSLDALAEFQTLNSNYAPDYGIGSGGQILMVIKSGTHNFHGELWEFNRNEDYDANNFFSNLAKQPRPRNQPGEQPGDRAAEPGVRRGQVQGGVAERRGHGPGGYHRPAEPHGQRGSPERGEQVAGGQEGEHPARGQRRQAASLLQVQPEHQVRGCLLAPKRRLGQQARAQRPGGEGSRRLQQGDTAAVGLAPLMDGERDGERDGGGERRPDQTGQPACRPSTSGSTTAIRHAVIRVTPVRSSRDAC